MGAKTERRQDRDRAPPHFVPCSAWPKACSSRSMVQYNTLYTPQDSVVVFIDHQPQMTFGVASGERHDLMNNVTLLAKAAKEFGVPTAWGTSG